MPPRRPRPTQRRSTERLSGPQLDAADGTCRRSVRPAGSGMRRADIMPFSQLNPRLSSRIHVW
eukprot:8765654-Lingulodinium_polyedra.AAC.1